MRSALTKPSATMSLCRSGSRTTRSASSTAVSLRAAIERLYQYDFGSSWPAAGRRLLAPTACFLLAVARYPLPSERPAEFLTGFVVEERPECVDAKGRAERNDEQVWYREEQGAMPA